MLYVLLATVYTWPLVLHLGTHVANDLGDPLLNMWIFAWNARTLPLTEAWWNMPQFYPATGVTAFSETLLGLTPITTPVFLATKNAVLAYNLTFYLSFVFTGLAGHWLGWSLTRRHDAALVSGLAFAFAPYRAAQLAHIQVLSSYWMPLAFVGLIEYFRDKRARWLVLFAGAWLMQALTCGYYFFYLSVLIGLWLVWFAVGRERWTHLARVIGMWAIAAALMAPLLYGYWRIQRSYGMRRWTSEIADFSADVASLLKASGNLRLWHWIDVFGRPEGELFPGVAIVLLIAGTAWWRWRTTGAGRRRIPAMWWLLGAAVVFMGIAATPAIWGPWKFEVGGLKLLSVGTPHKPLSVGFALLAFAAALHPVIRDVWARRSPFAFFIIGALVMWLFSLGPAPTIMNRPILYKSPYTWLMAIPGVEGVRVPSRFWMLAVLCLAVAAALAVVRLAARWPRARVAIMTLACLGVLSDGWPTPIELPERPTARPNRTTAQARLDLPVFVGHDLKALYWGIAHQRPLVNGYSGYFARHYWVLRYLLEEGDHDVLTHLARYGDLEIVVDHEEDPNERWRDYVESHPAAEVIARGAMTTSFRIRKPPNLDAPRRLEGRDLPIAARSANVGADMLPRMTDGDLVSRWAAGRHQRAGDSVTLDLGSPQQVKGVELLIGGYVADFPRKLLIEASLDGASWEHVWSGPGSGPTLTGSLLDPKLLPLIFPFEPRSMRYLRLTQQGTEPTFYWTISEIRIVGM